MKRVAVLVSNDLVHDQRVRKTCDVLRELELEITLIGRLLPTSEDIQRPYETYRLENLRFTKGALFYAEFNWKLYSYLYRNRKRFDAIWANDLDTLWPAFRIAQKCNIPIFYDSHEYFTEAAGLTGRPFPKAVWTAIERSIFPKLRFVFTVNDTIAEIYRKKYKVEVNVVRNVPVFHPLEERKTRAELSLPEGLLVILQGAFMDKDRGVIEAVQAMKHLPNVHLLLVGAGEEWEAAHVLRERLELQGQITILPKQPFEKLRQLTASADAGLTLDKAVHFNYLFSLPNKLFDYIHAGIPVVASPLPEVQKVVQEQGIGVVIADWQPEHIAHAIRAVLDQPKAKYDAALSQAAILFQWAHEAEVIKKKLRDAGVISEDSSTNI